MSVPNEDKTTPPVGAWSELGWASMEMGAIGLGIRCKCWWIANHSSTLLNQGQLDVSAQGQDNPPVGVWSKLGWASVEMGAIGLGIRCKCWWIANHSSTLLNQGKLDVSAQGQDNPPVGVQSELGWANAETTPLGLDIRCKRWWIANHSSALLNQ
jgi:hypothetical protein